MTARISSTTGGVMQSMLGARTRMREWAGTLRSQMSYTIPAGMAREFGSRTLITFHLTAFTIHEVVRPGMSRRGGPDSRVVPGGPEGIPNDPRDPGDE